MPVFLLFLLSIGLPVWAQCIAVDGDWITARDVAKSVPGLADADPDTKLGRAPFPGAQRVISPNSLPPELGDADIAPFCVERRMRTLSQEAISDAIDHAIAGHDEAVAHFEIVDFERSPMPTGRLEFSVHALPPPVLGRGDDPIMWRGKIYYAEGRSLPVWVRLRLWTEGEVCVLTRDVNRGEDLKPTDCQLLRKRYPPFTATPIRDAAALERTAAARHLAAGEPLYQSLIVRKADVEAGKLVEVRVVNGGAQVRLQAKANRSARKGESVALTNPANGKRLEGEVVGPDTVEVKVN